MKSVRLFYKKNGRMKFISHLDMNRFMARIIRKSGLDIWYTEGFNKHPYIVFGVPLALGFESEYEILDIRVNDDDILNEKIKSRMNEALPEFIRVFAVEEPILKIGKIAYARYIITFSDKTALKVQLEDLLKNKEIKVVKVGKHKTEKEINFAEHIVKYEVKTDGESTVLDIMLPVGNITVNPMLLIDKLFEISGSKCHYSVNRIMLFDEDKKEFK